MHILSERLRHLALRKVKISDLYKPYKTPISAWQACHPRFEVVGWGYLSKSGQDPFFDLNCIFIIYLGCWQKSGWNGRPWWHGRVLSLCFYFGINSPCMP